MSVLRDGTGGGHAPERPSERARRVGAVKRGFDAIRVEHDPQTWAAEQMDCVRLSRPEPGSGLPCGGAVLVAPIGTGKSESIAIFERFANDGAESGTRPVLRIEIGTAGTTESVPTAILATLGERRPDSGKEGDRWRRALDAMAAARVEILCIDEFDRAARRPTMSAPIATSLQERIMDPGICPVIVCGSSRAQTVLAKAPAVQQRLDEEIQLSPLAWSTEGDGELMILFLQALDEEIRERELLPALSGLHEGDLPRLLCEATRGRLRPIVKTVRFALGLAAWRRADSISREDVAHAVDAYCIRSKLVEQNPFDRPPVEASKVRKSKTDADACGEASHDAFDGGDEDDDAEGSNDAVRAADDEDRH